MPLALVQYDFVVLMMVSFGAFRFNPKQLVLYQHGKPVSLTQKQARLLALFLGQPDTIFSKEDILDQVWEGRAVSEQVVFQNISKLRTLIASGAIKTFPKRGYQWQIPLDSVSTTDPVSTDGEPDLGRGAALKPVQRFLFPILAAIVVMTLVFFSLKGGIEKKPPSGPYTAISFLPIEARFAGALEAELEEVNRLISDKFDTTSSEDADVSARGFMNSSFMERWIQRVTATVSPVYSRAF